MVSREIFPFSRTGRHAGIAQTIEPPNLLRQIFGSGDDHSSFAATHMLGDSKAEASYVASAPHDAALVISQHALRIILDHSEIMFGRQFHQGVYVGRQSV